MVAGPWLPVFLSHDLKASLIKIKMGTSER